MTTIRKFRYKAVVAGLVICCLVAIAFHHSASAGVQDPNQAKLLDSLDHPSLVLFYSSSCAPCIAEMRMLPALVKQAAGWHVAVASMTKPDASLTENSEALGVRILDLSSDDAAAILKSFNNVQIALPFALATDKNGSVCIKHQGLVGTDMIKDWTKQCLT